MIRHEANLTTGIKDLHMSLEYAHSTLDDLKGKLDLLEQESGVEETRVSATEDDARALTQDLATTIAELDYIENQTHCSDLRTDGVKETPEESWSMTKDKVE